MLREARIEGFERRFYRSDMMVLRELAAATEARNSRELSRQLNLSRRQINVHLRKLEELGFIDRLGSRRCCFQVYRLSREFEIPVSRILEHFIELFQRLPGRFYFPAWFATPPSSYGQSSFSRLTGGICMPGRPGGRSVPFGVHLPVLRREGFRAPELWIPFVDVSERLPDWDELELSERVSDDFLALEEIELSFERTLFSWDGFQENFPAEQN